MILGGLRIRGVFATNSIKTVEVEAETSKGTVRAPVPIGTSRGKHEVNYLPVEACIKEFSRLKKLIEGKKFSYQEEFDNFLKSNDGAENFDKIGGNLSLALSYTFLKASALSEGKEIFEFLNSGKIRMPLPLSNIIGAKGMKDIEEFLFIPNKQTSFLESVGKLASTYTALGKILKTVDPKFTSGRDMESAWRVSIDHKKILSVLSELAKQNDLSIGLDMATSELWDGSKYTYSDGRSLSPDEQVDFVKGLIETYKLKYVEDPFQEDDFDSFAKLLKVSKSALICGDDLLTTNPKRLKVAVQKKSVSAAIVKPNQIGTVTDTMEFVREAKKNKIVTVMSHRSGETDDAIISHLAVGLGCDYVKFGVPAGERIVKLNELIRIEERM